MILFTKYSHEAHSGKYIKPLCYSSLILKQTVCLDIRGLYRISKAEQKSRFIFRDVNRSIALQSPYMQIRGMLFVFKENAAKHLVSHLNPFQSTQPSHGLYATYDYSVKMSDPNKRDLYTCGVWVEFVDPVADLCRDKSTSVPNSSIWYCRMTFEFKI